MAQIFRPRATTVFRAVLACLIVAVVAALWFGFAVTRSDQAWGVGVAPEQPVPFNHALHVGGLGIDCRYCHTSVEWAAHAGIPSAGLCMSCHSQIWTAAPVLAPIQGSAASGEPLAWARVHDLPDHAYFHHGIHVSKGVGCESCHGRVDQMARIAKAETLSMLWCLDCHRDPAPYLRPREAITAMGWQSPYEDGEALIEHYGIRIGQLTDCSTCHR